MVVNDICTDALLRLNVVDATATPSAADSALALRVLNGWIGEMATQQLTIPFVTRTTWTLAASQASYTVGSGAQVNVVRPQSTQMIQQVNIVDTAQNPDLELPLFMLTDSAYQALALKAQTGATYPSYAYYQPTYPTGTLYLWMITTKTDLLGVLYSTVPLQAVTQLQNVDSLPPAFIRWMETNLAKALVTYFTVGPDVSSRIDREAATSMTAIKGIHATPEDLSIDLALAPNRWGRYSIFSDTP